MATRLVWNFELQELAAAPFPTLVDQPTDKLNWESRSFWPDSPVIPLYGLTESFLHLSNYTFKQRYDQYLLLDNYPFNVKRRQDTLLYKPLLRDEEHQSGYGKKINLETAQPDALLPGSPAITAGQLRELIRTKATCITVDKEALVYKFTSTPVIKLELSRLTINKQIYFSACIEGQSSKLVELLRQRLLHQQPTSDYVNFLKGSAR